MSIISSSFRRRPESRRAAPGSEMGCDSVCQPARNRSNGLFSCHSRIHGNGLYQPLDSSFRWNDDGGEVKYLLSFRSACGWQAGMTLKVSGICLLFRRHSGKGRNPGERRRGMKCAVILSVNLPATSQNGLFGCHPRIDGNGLYQPLDSSFRWNDDGGEVKYLLSFRSACGWQAGMTMKVSRICLLFRRQPIFRRRPESRRAAPGNEMGCDSVCQPARNKSKWFIWLSFPHRREWII